MTRTILDMEERLFDVEELAELEFGNDAKGYRLTAGKLRAAIKSRRSLLTEYEHGVRNFTDYERRCIRADAEALAYDGLPAEKSKWAGVAFALMAPNAWA